MKVQFLRAIMENRVNLQGIAEEIDVGGLNRQEHSKDKKVILRDVTVAFSANMRYNYSKELANYGRRLILCIYIYIYV